MASIVVLILYLTQTNQQEIKELVNLFLIRMNARVKMLKDPTFRDISQSIVQIKQMNHADVLSIVIVNCLPIHQQSDREFQTKDYSVDKYYHFIHPLLEIEKFKPILKMFFESGEKAEMNVEVRRKTNQAPKNMKSCGQAVYSCSVKEKGEMFVFLYFSKLIAGCLDTLENEGVHIILKPSSIVSEPRQYLKIEESMKTSEY